MLFGILNTNKYLLNWYQKILRDEILMWIKNKSFFLFKFYIKFLSQYHFVILDYLYLFYPLFLCHFQSHHFVSSQTQ